MSARHILVPVHDFSHGGTERIAFRLAERWLESGRQVTVLAGARAGPMEARVPAGARIEVLDPPRPRSPLSRLSLGSPMANRAASLAPDAVFLIGNFHFILGRAMKSALPHAAIVGKVSNPLVPANLGTGVLARAVASGWSAGIDALVAMSQPSARGLAPLIPHRTLAVIPDPFLDDEVEITAREGRPLNPLKILVAGRLEPQKDPLLAIQVAQELARGHVPFELTILGSGAMEASVQMAKRDSGLGDELRLVGHVADPSPYFEAAEILLMTSQYEGVPAVIGEGLAHGLPFVATPCSEWIGDIADNSPRLGSVTKGRSPAELVEALLARQGIPFPTESEIASVVDVHRLGQAADAYLALFDRLRAA